MNKFKSSCSHLTEKVPIKHFLLITRTTLILLFTCVFFTMAQNEKSISGRVLDEQGVPIIGANVIEVGETTNGTITDVDGLFSLNVGNNATIQVTYIG